MARENPLPDPQAESPLPLDAALGKAQRPARCSVVQLRRRHRTRKGAHEFCLRQRRAQHRYHDPGGLHGARFGQEPQRARDIGRIQRLQPRDGVLLGNGPDAGHHRGHARKGEARRGDSQRADPQPEGLDRRSHAPASRQARGPGAPQGAPTSVARAAATRSSTALRSWPVRAAASSWRPPTGSCSSCAPARPGAERLTRRCA